LKYKEPVPVLPPSVALGEKMARAKWIGGIAGTAVAIALLLAMPTAFAAPTNSAAHANLGVHPAKSSCATPTYIDVVMGSTYSATADYNCTMKATATSGAAVPFHSWSYETFRVVGPVTVKVTLKDCCLKGDYYALWVDSGKALKAANWGNLGHTPAVNTSSALTAPTYNPLWTGVGHKLSAGSFTVYVPSGVTFMFRINDLLFAQMVSKLAGPCAEHGYQVVTVGCTATGISVGPGWSAAGLTAKFVAV
jgi:hypothetical protein